MVDYRQIAIILIPVFAIIMIASMAIAYSGLEDRILRFYLNKIHPVLKSIFFKVIIPAAVFVIPLLAYYKHLMN